MSFGFRKKLHVTPKKSKNLQKQKEMLDNNLTQNCDEKTKQKHNFDTVITNTIDVVENITKTTTTTTTNVQKNDKNGNTGEFSYCYLPTYLKFKYLLML